jgi:valyl-tRNA synthetase
MSSIELDPAYDPKIHEKKQLELWELHQCFKADPHSEKPAYCIVIPPPNVTGALHMGHALVNTLQDVLIRYKRMSGFEALWVPGTDHAGIATQTLVEKNLIQKFGKRRNEWSREEFLEHVWDWKKASESRILSQLKSLGSSCDFSMLAFTMDETRSNAVKVVFKKLFDEGLIYRGDYLVNWDPVTQTALADDEVEYEEKQGHLYTLRYPIDGSDEFIDIATTRPETMLGDTAVAVNPSDERYHHLIGKKINLPLTNRQITIVADMMVDKEFGTGAVKITPAHDMNDYQVALRLGLKMINLLNPDGTMNENGGIYQGLSFPEARKQIVHALNQQGVLIKQEKHIHRVGISYRSKAVIEPYLSKQWFVKMDPFKTLLRKLVDEKHVRLVPETYQNTYDHWINNLRDWCISRQLWWGHRIPIWYRKDDRNIMLCEGPEGIPLEVKNNPHAWVQDEDVLDTWFSSALWPFASLGWPDSDLYLKKFYPNSTLVTGHDILFFWVARMMAFGSHIMKEAPFPEVFLHGLIFGKSYFREEKSGDVTYIMGEEKNKYDMGEALPKGVKYRWEKMSKSKGNVLDPVEIMHEYGTDAVRMALVTCASQARQIDLDRRRFEEYKNFANKLWNGARFIFMNLENIRHEELNKESAEYSLEDRWILTRLTQALKEQKKSLDQYFFDKAASSITDFFWNDFCAYYLEISKPILSGKKGTKEEKLLKQKILLSILTQVLCALHPFIPFVTEALFQKIKENFGGFRFSHDPLMTHFADAMKSKTLATATFPCSNFEDLKSIADFDDMLHLLHQIREMRGELQIPPQDAVTCHIENPSDVIRHNISMIFALTKIEKAIFESPQSHSIVSTKAHGQSTTSVILPMHLVGKEIERLEKDLCKIQKEIEGLIAKLSVSDFVDRAPKEVVKKLQDNLERLKSSEVTITHKLQSLKNVS